MIAVARAGFLVAVAAMVALLATPGARAAGLPEATVSAHFKTVGAGFMLDLQAGAARYFVSYSVRQGFGKTVRIKVLFDNPASPSHPLATETQLKTGQTTLDVQSGPVGGMRSGKNYKATLIVIDPATGAELARHVQSILWAGGLM